VQPKFFKGRRAPLVASMATVERQHQEQDRADDPQHGQRLARLGLIDLTAENTMETWEMTLENLVSQPTETQFLTVI